MRHRRFVRRAPRRLRWLSGSELLHSEGGQVDFNISAPALVGTAASPAVTILSTSQVLDDLDNSGTIMRIVGNLWFLNTDTVNTAWIQCGIKVTDVGATAAQYLVDDGLDAKWMWWKAFTLPPNNTTAGVDLGYSAVLGNWPGGVWDVDIKCRRRIVADQQLELYVWYGNVGAPVPVEKLFGIFQSRVLCKLR